MKKYIFIVISMMLLQVVSSQNNDTTTMNNGPMLGLRTVIYKVNDLNKAIEWYTNVFKTEPYFNEPFYVGFNIGGYELGIMPIEGPKSETADNVLAYWGVEDINAEYNRIIQLGATEHEIPTNYGGELMVASVIDPWGNVVGLIYNPAFKLD